MKHSKIKNGVSLLCILLLVLGSLFLTFGLPKLIKEQAKLADAEVKTELSQELKDEYAFGDVFTLPACTFEKEGTVAQGAGALEFPDGSQSKDNEITLNQSGEYVLRYIATLDGKTYTHERAFTVSGKLATYGSGKTSVAYENCNAFGASTSGLMLRIASGDAVTFDHVFDMSEMTMATKLVEGFVVPDVQGKADFSRMVFTFTDLEDPSVQLIYFGNFHNDVASYGLTFFTAAGNGQVQCGLEYVGKLHKGSTLGCLVPHSFMAMDTGLYYGAKKPTPTAPDEKLFCISYDGASNQAWAGGKIISDLDDSNYYDKLWFGFPSGKAKLTVSGANYNNATANICLTEVFGVELSAETLVDNDLPTITIDNEYEEMPTAVVGGTYPVPSAKASDLSSGACDVNVSVWFDYGSETSRKMIDVKNGRFQVDNVGTYAIVYEAKDYSGNVAREVLWVRAEDGRYLEPLSVKIDESFEKDIEVGTLQALPEAEVFGASGNYTVTYSLTKGRTVCDIADGKFCLEEKGAWVLTCTAVDYIDRQAIAVCEINGIVSGKPVTVETVELPTAYVSGSTYVLPVLYAYDYSNGKEQKTCDVIVEYNGSKKTYQSGSTFVPTVENHQDKIKLTYVCEGTTLAESEVPVLVVFGRERIPGNTERYRDVIQVEKYFYTADDITFTNGYQMLDVSGLKMTANQSLDSAKMTFANPQMADGAAFDFLTVPNEAKFERLAITFKDSQDSSIAVKVVLAKDEGTTLLQVGDTLLSLNLDFDGAAATAYSVGFSNDKLVVNSTTAVDVEKTESGKPFCGFPSHKVYLEVEMLDVEAGASIFLQKISGVNVSNKQDTSGPSIQTAESVVMNAFKDEVYTVQKVIVGDALAPNSEAKVTIVAPDGSIVSTVDGVELNEVDATLDYEIKLTQYGLYTVSVTAKESDGWKYSNKSVFEYVVSVIDGEKPTITFEKEFDTKIEVGDLLIIPDYEVADNYSTADKITVMTVITNPKGMPVYLYGDSNAVRCEYAGVYKVTMYVYDEMGNLTTFTTNVTVE